MCLESGELARPERFELPTSWFVARHSIQLSYGRAATKASGRSNDRPVFGGRDITTRGLLAKAYIHPVSSVSHLSTNRSDPKRPADRITAPTPAVTRPAREGATAASAGTISR